MRRTQGREDQESSAAGIARALQSAFEPKEVAAEAEMDRLIERLGKLGGVKAPLARHA